MDRRHHCQSPVSSADNTVLVSVMHANNETGVIQPLADIVRTVREHEASSGCVWEGCIVKLVGISGSTVIMYASRVSHVQCLLISVLLNFYVGWHQELPIRLAIAAWVAVTCSA